ncbi:MAG: sodium:alanine symporter family protein [Hyphomicrobiales bacterium]
MNGVTESVNFIDGVVWGPVMMVLLVGVGLYLQFGLKAVPIRKLGRGLALLGKPQPAKRADGEISPFSALMTALSATVGVGNIAGVATAIASGGPGAVFWIWVTGLVGMATKYAEAVLAVRFREVDDNGDHCGGPMYYLRNGLKGSYGRFLGMAFAIFAAFAAFGIGSAVQANSVADGLEGAFAIPHWATGVAMVVLVGIVTVGGIRRIALVASKLVPFMVVVYSLGGILVLILNAGRIATALDLIFTYAFTPAAARGGFAGAAVMAAMRFGIARGLFSNEAGLGSAPIAHAAARTRDPVRQGLIAMVGVFIDTLVVCSITALVIISSGQWSSGKSGAALTSLSFNASLTGIGQYVVIVGVVLFAYSTALSWSFYGEKCFQYLFGLRLINYYRIVFVLFLAVGATAKLNLVWNLADIANGLMAIPNLIGLAVLSPILFKMTRDYFDGRPYLLGEAW